MIDPENVIVHCPNGHELQAAREHISQALTCPVCSVEFVPQVKDNAVPPPPTDAATLGYAGTELLRQPVEFPGYTSWMLWIWMGLAILQVLNAIVMPFLVDPEQMKPGQAPNVNSGLVVFGMAFGCIFLVAFCAAVVLQLMWIFRIHKDAKRSQKYADVSPGLALGMNFVPMACFVWTAWTMRKLSTFVASFDKADQPDVANRIAASETATRSCFISSIVITLFWCVVMSVFIVAIYGAFQNAMGPGGNFDQAKYQQEVNSAMPPWSQMAGPIIGLVGTVIYFNAVRKLEAALYPFLGAPPR